MKDLAECKAARISDLESINSKSEIQLQIQCTELRSQRTHAEEQLCKMETRLSQAEEKIRQLSKQTNDALTVRVNRCLGLYYSRSRRINGCNYEILSAVRRQ